VKQDLGRTIALAIAQHLLIFPKRPGGQLQFASTLPFDIKGESFKDLHAWIKENLSADLSNSVLANRLRMNVRTFQRQYKMATGLAPAHAVERFRIEAARRMLAETQLSLSEIVALSGFGSEETVRRSFLRLLAATPQDYRKRFQRNF
jgi:transcriptional regulator GlxA family with amidase domain